ncbi:hypothetical protein [Arthrobacter sp. UYEF3]|uniref:hypothetical protein n=1 Tax=Arthrobacter sp. UYEF3 TaxID=1756365 RepID=UPI0033987727
MDDDEIREIGEAAARLESAKPEGQEITGLYTAMAAAVSHGKAVRDVAAAAHLTALEVLDAADAALYPRPVLPPQEMAG